MLNGTNGHPFEEADPYEEILRIREELGDRGADGRVVLMRKLPSGVMAHVGELSAQDFTMGRVIKDWGGGHYEAAFYSGRTKLGAAIVFDVDPSIPSRIPDMVAPVKEPVVEVHTAQPNAQMAVLDQTIGRMADLLNQLVVVMATGKPQEAFGPREAMDLSMRMAEAMRPTQSAPSLSPESMIELISAGINLGKQTSEGGGSEGGMIGVLKEFAGPVGDILKSAMERERRASTLSDVSATATGQGPRPAAAPTPLPPPRPEMPPIPEGAPTWLLHLKPHLPTILNWARAGKDPSLYAEVILDNMEPGARMEVAQFAKDPQFVDKTLAALPMFAPYSAWATEILTAIKELSAEETDGPGPIDSVATG